MIPNNENYEREWDEDTTSDMVIREMPSLTYAMNISEAELDEHKNSFVGKVDDTEAVRQAVMKILNTERYEYEIYSWDYGIELQDLYGEPLLYCMSEIKRRITEALLADDRIESVENFNVQRVGRRTLSVAFTVITAEEEEIDMESEVEI